MKFAAWLLTFVTALVIGGVVHQSDVRQGTAGVVVFSAAERGCPIVVPGDASDAERRAASTLAATMAQARGGTLRDFPVYEERGAIPRRAIFVGATRRAQLAPRALVPRPPYDTGVRWVVRDGAVFIDAERRDAIESAVSWFLEKHLGAHWFIPGPLGSVVPRRDEFSIPVGGGDARPGFVSRDLGMSGPAAEEWFGRNRLQARFEHGHNLAHIFRTEDFQRVPEMAPMRAGQRFIPAAGDQNWQPNFLSAEAAKHAASAAMKAFDANPSRLSFSLSTNDSVRYDDSPATLEAVSPPRYFRHRPDYSNLVFRFNNAVATMVAEKYPDRYLPAYAYYWCENAPDFSVARQVVPYLTADRSQWSHPAFAAEDRALIERWTQSGAEIVGVYDYFYGMPFLSPRPTIYAVKDSIPFQFRAGVRAFYAEAYPNWALDGPKLWLAAQLLWAPETNPDDLLATYYREFWGEAEAPMREFFAVAERTWLEQPGPALWLRYYQDEDQSHIYPEARRAELHAALEHAARLAVTDAVRARVGLVAAGFSVSEAFWKFSAARERASQLARNESSSARLIEAWKAYRESRAEFVATFKKVREQQPLAVAAQDLAIYLRHEPDSRIVATLLRTTEGRAALSDSAYLANEYVGASPERLTQLRVARAESLQDPNWAGVSTIPVDSPAVVEWTQPGGPWRGSGEPWEGRTVELDAKESGKRVLRFSSCRTEGIGQWLPARAGELFSASVKVRAKSSPGTATFLIVTFIDEKNRHIGIGRVDRLPAAASVQETELWVITSAPANARFIGFGLRVLNQINDDFAEFSGPSLKRIDPE